MVVPFYNRRGDVIEPMVPTSHKDLDIMLLGHLEFQISGIQLCKTGVNHAKGVALEPGVVAPQKLQVVNAAEPARQAALHSAKETNSACAPGKINIDRE